MQPSFLSGRLVRLNIEEPQVLAKNFARWQNDSLYMRLLSTGSASLYSAKSIQDWIEKDFLVEQPKFILFGIRRLDNDQLIGDIVLDPVDFPLQERFVGISIGERENWSKGFGTDAMRLILRYAFNELNLHRVSLTVFEYNPRAIQSYHKAGFREEGRLRQCFERDGRRWDLIFMGILRPEWQQINGMAS